MLSTNYNTYQKKKKKNYDTSQNMYLKSQKIKSKHILLKIAVH